MPHPGGCRRRRRRCAGTARSGPRPSSAGAWRSTGPSSSGCGTSQSAAGTRRWSSPPPRRAGVLKGRGPLGGLSSCAGPGLWTRPPGGQPGPECCGLPAVEQKRHQHRASGGWGPCAGPGPVRVCGSAPARGVGVLRALPLGDGADVAVSQAERGSVASCLALDIQALAGVGSGVGGQALPAVDAELLCGGVVALLSQEVGEPPTSLQALTGGHRRADQPSGPR